MQLSLFSDDRSDNLIILHERLRDCLGEPTAYVALDPVSQLVMGMVGGKTREEVSLAVFCRLKEQFVSWSELRDAELCHVARLIAPVTYSEVKAERLIASLRRVTYLRGSLTLDFLSAMPVPAALGWLERLPGVGRKTSATVLNFSTLQMPVLVIDTHHLRVKRRMGFVHPRAFIEDAHNCITPLLPMDWTAAEMDTHHQLLKRLGQTYCKARSPLCAECPVGDLCSWASNKPTGAGLGLDFE